MNLQKAIATDSNYSRAKAELGELLIESRPVRDLDLGIRLLEELKTANQLPSYLESVLAKAHRQKGNITLDENFDLRNIGISPAVLREERINFRSLIKKFSREKDEESLKKTLNQFYNLAVYATLLYRNHDCSSGVSGRTFDRALQKAEKYAHKIDFSFEKHGYIKYCKFLSKHDWKNFEKAFGGSDKSFDPAKALAQE